MKQLTIVVKPFRAAAVLEAIAALGLTPCSIRQSHGRGRPRTTMNPPKETFVTTTFRTLAGGTALTAGLWFLTAAAAAPPELSKDTAKAATAADVADLQKKLEEIAAAPDKSKGAIRT